MIIFLFPLINFDKLFKKLKNMLISSKIDERIKNLPDKICPICNNNIEIAFESVECGHLFCYFCIKSNLIYESSYKCPKCNKNIFNIKRKTIE
jgi:peroxin-2